MTGQRWRTYALLLHFIVTYKVATALIDRLGSPWGYVGTALLLSTCLVGMVVPAISDRTTGRHRVEE